VAIGGRSGADPRGAAHPSGRCRDLGHVAVPLFRGNQGRPSHRPVSTFEGNVGSGALFASNALIASKPDAIRAFIAGWLETVDYMRAHKAETVKIESELNQFSENVMSREYDFTIGMHTKDCRFDPESLSTLRRSFVEMNLAEGELDMSKLYTETTCRNDRDRIVWERMNGTARRRHMANGKHPLQSR